MDELLKAITEAIRAGSQLAYPALLGYFAVRAMDALSTPLALVSVVWITGRTVRAGMAIYYEKDAIAQAARQATWKAERETYETRLKLSRAGG